MTVMTRAMGNGGNNWMAMAVLTDSMRRGRLGNGFVQLSLETPTDVIAALEDCLGADFELDAGQVLDHLGDLQVGSPLIGALIRFMEDNPDADLGVPGPVVKCIERLPVSGYVEQLSASVARNPTMYTIWMAERLLNDIEEEQDGLRMLSTLRSLSYRDDLDPDHADHIAEALERHG